MTEEANGSKQLVVPYRSGRRRATWAVWLAVLFVAAAGLSRYRVENSLADWLPQLAGHDAISTYVVIGGETDLLDPQRLSGLTHRLDALQEVTACVSPAVAARFAPMIHTADQGTARGGAVFDDPGYTGLFCFARAGVEDERFLSVVRGVLRAELGDGADKLALGGPAVFTEALNDWSQRRSPLLSGLVIVVGAGLLWWVVRDPWSVASATTAIVGSQVMLAGTISWLGVPVGMVLSMVWPLMMALGFSFAAHRALRRGVSGTLALCALTTAGGIVGFVFCQFPPIRSFAVWGSVGLMLTWVSVMLLVKPASGAGRRCGRGGQASRRWLRPIQYAAYTHVVGRPAVVVTAGVVLTVAAFVCLPLLQLQNAPIRYFPKTSRVYRDYKQLDHRLIGMLPFEVTVRETPRAGIDADVTGMLLKTPGVRLIVNVSLLDPRGGWTYLGFADGDSLNRLVAAQQRWRAWAGDHDTEITWSGAAAQLHGMEVGVVRVASVAVPAMVLVAALVIWLIGGRDWRLALTGAWVNLFPVVVMVVLVVTLGWPISLPSLMIGAIAVGAAVDDTLHIVAGMNTGRGVRRVLVGCWRPCVGSSLITAACMTVFVLSPFRPTIEFGVLMALTVIAALVGNMLLLPAAIILMKRKPHNPRLDPAAATT